MSKASARVAVHEDGGQADVTIAAPDGLAATFTYDLSPHATLESVAISWEPGANGNPKGLLRSIGDLPLARLERVASVSLTRRLNGTEDLTPGELVDHMFPRLREADRGNARRRRDSLIWLAERAREYELAEQAGVGNPTHTLAEAHGVTPGTVRGWLLRARREGLAPKSAHPNAARAEQEGGPA